MKRVKSESSLFFYYCFYNFEYETKTVASPQFIVQIALPFVHVSLLKKKKRIFFY
jgi:hypothetical protein